MATGLNKPQEEEDTKLIEFSKPPSELSDVEDQADEVESRFKRRAIKLKETEKADLERELYELIQDWKDSNSSLESKLKEWNDAAEGVTTVTNFPWKGACYDKETEVLTDSGWKLFRDVSVEDLVYSVNPETGIACYMPISRLIVQKEKELIDFKSKSVRLSVTPNHNIYVFSQESRKNEFIPASHFLKIDGGEFKIPLTSKWQGFTPDKTYGFDSDDWMEFIGWFASEGYFTDQIRSNGKSQRIGLCQSNTANFDKCVEIKKMLERMGIKFTYTRGKQFNLSVKSFNDESREELKSLGKCHQKFIPRKYLSYSSESLKIMLDSMLKGDGCESPAGKNSFRVKSHFSYFTTSKKLADDVQEICQKIGIRGTITKRDRSGSGGEINGRKISGKLISYQVNINIKEKAKVISLDRNIRQYNDFVYCVTTPWHTLYVRKDGIATWCGNSELRIPLEKIKMREIKSTINRTSLRPVPFLMVKYAGPNELYETSRSLLKDLEDFVEDKIKNDTNVHQMIKESINPITRDGTAIPHIPWETEFERVTDYKLYTDLGDFVKDYPDSDSAGISEDRYDSIVKTLADGGKYEVQFEYDDPIYDGPKAYLVPLLDFVHWPIFVADIKDMICHGKRIWYTSYQLEDMQNMGKFPVKDDVESVIKQGGDIHEDSLTVSRDNIEGITRDQKESQEFECFELVYKKDMDDDGVKEKYLITYAFRKQKILRIEKYPIRKGKTTYFPLRFIKRDNRFLGVSLVDDVLDLAKEATTIHRQRINSRTITHVPSFLGKNGAKGRFDPSRSDLSFYPGVTFWVDDVADVKQFDIRPVDLSGSVDEETLLYQLVDLVTGSSSGLSGQSNPLDPRAPARKQSELLRQSTNRIDDYVDELLQTFADIGQHVLDMYYQYGPDRIKYYVSTEDGQQIEKEIERSKLYNPNIRFVVNGTSVFMNPDSEFSRAQEIEQIIATNPITAQNPRIRKESLNRLLKAGREKDEMKLIPTDQDIAKLTGEQGVLPTEQQNDLKLKEKLAQERIAQRVAEGDKSRAHAAELAAANIAVKIHEQINTPPTGGEPNAPQSSGQEGL